MKREMGCNGVMTRGSKKHSWLACHAGRSQRLLFGARAIRRAASAVRFDADQWNAMFLQRRLENILSEPVTAGRSRGLYL